MVAIKYRLNFGLAAVRKEDLDLDLMSLIRLYFKMQ